MAAKKKSEKDLKPSEAAATAPKMADDAASFKHPETPETKAGFNQRAAEIPAHEPMPSHLKFPLVGIGASAGGLEALQEFFNHMPERPGVAFVVVIHLHPGYTSMMPEILSKATGLKVVEADNGMPVERDTVYVVPPRGMLEIVGGVLRLASSEGVTLPYLPIDHFFRSLADDAKDNAIAVILSGTGTDGTLGVRAVKAEGGMAMVQNPASAKYSGMPDSAVNTGMADYILPPAEMPDQLVAYTRGITPPEHRLEAPPIPKEPLQRILGMLRARTGHDFSSYKMSTVLRRIERRMNVHHISEPAQYAFYLQENPYEIDNLFKELLISVTSFFRDPQAFETLSEKAIIPLLQARSSEQTLRIWIPGCASGEEAYSIAILVNEAMEHLKKRVPVQIFGTDLDAKAIETARTGVYMDGITADVAPRLLDRYFVLEHSVFKIKKDIREEVIFAVQNVIKDPPFTKLDMIVCRNLMIYLDAGIQQRLLGIFHYALKPGGILFLGPSETVGAQADLFDSLDHKWKIYRRKESMAAIRSLMEIPAQLAFMQNGQMQAEHRIREKQAQVPEMLERYLLDKFTPTAIVIDDRGTIVFIHGRTGLYLEPSEGQPRNNILEMAREGLARPLESAMRQAAAENSEVSRNNIRVRTNGDFSDIHLTVNRITEPEALRGLLLVTLRPAASEKTSGKETQVEESPNQVVELERELQNTKESLQTTIEELETSNEELKSSNEELQSTNEELQSSNEELETSKEELQSLNEELTTVNSELQSKLQELARANDDMQNLLNGIQVATIFLDNQLKVKRFTEQAKDVVRLIQSDVGRPLTDLATKLNYDRLAADCAEVLKTLIPMEKEVSTVDDKWHLMRIMPYRTTDNMIDGVVITLVDITQRKRAEEALNRLTKDLFVDLPFPLLTADLDGRILEMNEEAQQTLGWPRQDVVGQSLKTVIAPERHADVDAWLTRCRSGSKVSDQESVCRSKSGELHPVLITMTLLRDRQERPNSLSIALKDARSEHRAPEKP